VMRDEHVEIRRRMDGVAAEIKARNVAGIRQAIAALIEVLSVHNMKEEEVLYPMADQAAGGPREQDDLVKRLQAV
ncbi:MAG TPA: hemerythrin domain-containing protein, partial [Dehalococcoidia bacterium]|nr:hemerythrin domain-containing protein [Dehalococcoidia bacterium]